MTDFTLKTGIEILDDFFKKLSDDQEVDMKIMEIISKLWDEKRLFTKIYIERDLEQFIKEQSK